MRSRPLAIVAAILSFTLAGCLSSGTPHARRIDSGRPLETPDSEAYLVWHDREGWHLRARSDVPRRFHGVIDTGLFSRVRPVGIDEDAAVQRSGWIAFSFVAGGEQEVGFDWGGLGCPELTLYVDDDSRPLRVFAGLHGASPPRMPFVLCR